jgi:hypothetical protein
MATPPHGSQLPQVFEGAPFHSDSFMVSFNPVADGNSVMPYAGALVTIASTPDEACVIPTATGGFLLGICEESGILQGQINVIIRGVVTVTTDANVTEGNYLDASTVGGHDGMVGLSPANAATRLIAIQSVNGSVTPAPILALLF